MLLGVREADDDSFAILDRYFAAGGRFFDTANNYGAWTEDILGTRTGDSERLLGRWIADRGVADQVVVATKCGAGKADPARPLSGEPPTNYEGLAPELVRAELAASLERLGLDRVGVYYGHVDDRTRDITEIADTFAGLVEEGLVAVPDCPTRPPGGWPRHAPTVGPPAEPSSVPGSRSTRSTGRLPAPRRTPSSPGRVSTTPSRTRS